MPAKHQSQSGNLTSTLLAIAIIASVAGFCGAAKAQLPALDAKYRGSLSVVDRTTGATSSAGTPPPVATGLTPEAPPQPATPISVSYSSAAVAVEPGQWVCVLDRDGKSASSYTVRIQVAADRMITVASYDNAPATITSTQPLSFMAVNPRDRPRTVTFVWPADNSMVVAGGSIDNPNASFRDQGRCVKM